MINVNTEEATQRLARLENFLRADPENQALLSDAFATALAARKWEHAEFHLKNGLALGIDPLGWGLREGDFWLAQQRWDDAKLTLEALLARYPQPPEYSDIIRHNLAFAEFCSGHLAAAVDHLAPIFPQESEGSYRSVQPAVKQLWLRLLHRQGETESAVAWTKRFEQANDLDPHTAGIASLAALDDEDFESTQRWTALALTAEPPQVEALVSRSSLALAEKDVNRARQYADTALRYSPEDGRALSAHAFADMLAGDFDIALQYFQRALTSMPEHIGTWHGQGWVQIMRHDLAGARKTFETALAMDRNFAESHGGLAAVLAMSGEHYLAQQHVELALRLDRSNMSGRYAQAILTGAIKDTASFQRFAHRLLSERNAPLGGKISDWLPPAFTEEAADVSADQTDE